MSAITDRPATRSPTPSTAPACARCASPLHADQEWCLECGAARATVHRAPDWRIPVAIVAAVAVAVLFGLAIALASLSGKANQSAPPAVASHPAPTGPIRIGFWPPGLAGWTVEMAATRTRPAAEAIARELAPTVLGIGILNSGQHPRLAPGQWIIYSGIYPTQGAAGARTGILTAHGHTEAHPLLVG